MISIGEYDSRNRIRPEQKSNNECRNNTFRATRQVLVLNFTDSTRFQTIGTASQTSSPDRRTEMTALQSLNEMNGLRSQKIIGRAAAA